MEIVTQNLILRSPNAEDYSFLKAFEERNKIHLAKWESAKPLSSEADYRTLLINWLRECEEGSAVRFLIFSKEKTKIIGMCHFTQIFRSVFQACYLGYKIDHQYEGKGLMFEALQKLIPYMFEELELHRIMANYMPFNRRSAKLLNRLGFIIEGYAKNYLQISNKWEDHILTALSYEQWKKHQLKPSLHTSLRFREANFNDLEAIVHLLFDDFLGRTREVDELSDSYWGSFLKICSDPNSEIIVGELGEKIIGVMQITFIRHLTYQGGEAAHIEGVRIHKDHRHQGLGKLMFQWAFERIKERGCQRVQLMTDKRRVDVCKFYEHLGFTASHEGMKLTIQ